MTLGRSLLERGGPSYWWLKYVRGFDARKHCIRCLVGVKSLRVGRRMPHGVLIPLDEASAPYLYLCGGFSTWEKNLHVAMAPDPEGEFSAVASNGAVVTFRGLRRLPIPPLPAGFRGLPLSFTTCRNFQFGYSVFAESSTARE